MGLTIEKLQPQLIKQFKVVIQENQLSSAYVFSGASGTGKHALAVWIAMRLFCQDVKDGRPCGKCSECRRVLSGNHPDLVVLDSDARSIKVDDMRQIKAEMSKTGVERNQRVFLIDHAERMTPAAANSILKFYEEPTAGMVIILATTAKNQLLPTILSRAQVVNFQPADQKTLQKQLTKGGAAPLLAAAAARLSADLETAQALAEDSAVQARIKAALAWLSKVSQGDDEAFILVQTTLLPEAKTLDDQKQLLALIAIAYEDALNLHYQVAASMVFDSDQAVQALAKLDAQSLAASVEFVLTAQIQLGQNVTFQSDLEQLTLRLLAQVRRKR